MALVNPIPVKVDIPHEPGQWCEFRRLSWKQLKEARKKNEAESREEAKALGAELFGALMRSSGDDKDDAAKAERLERIAAERKWRPDQFDRDTVLTKGLVAWSYDVPLGNDAIGQLDEQTAEWAAHQIIEMSRPITEDQQKNEIARSISS